MKWSQFFSLMAGVYIAPHVTPAFALVVGVILVALSLVSFSKGD